MVKCATRLNRSLALAACLCLTTCGFGLFWSFGAFFKAWGTQWPSSQEFLSKVFITSFPVFAFSAALFGFLSDRWGLKQALVWAAGLMAGGCLFLALSDETWMIFLGWGFLVSAGLAAGVTSALVAIQRSFQSHKGLAAGVAMSGFGLGTVTLAAVSEVLMASFGWRKAAMILGAITVASYVLAAWAVDGDSSASEKKDPRLAYNRTREADVERIYQALCPEAVVASSKGNAPRVFENKAEKPRGFASRRWEVTDLEVAVLKRLRDKLSFVIFALSAKNRHNMAFSTEEAAGCKEVLTQLARELVDVSRVFEKKAASSVQEEIMSRVETPP